MKKNEFYITTIALFIVSIIFITVPSIINVFGTSGNTTSFNVTLTVTTGNPVIVFVNATSDNPDEGTTKIVHFYFNATHPNGVSNIPASGAQVKINQSGNMLNSTGCTVLSTGGITNRFDCNITINFYTSPGIWTINATITDLSNNSAINTTAIYTNGNTYGVTLKTNSISFSGTPGQTVTPSTQQQVNNTGNVAYSQINLTAFDIISGSNVVASSNFTANTTGTGSPGHTLINNTAITLGNSNVAIQGYKDLNLSLSIPAGTSNGTYTSSGSWIVTLS